jgi:hypothetical protein
MFPNGEVEREALNGVVFTAPSSSNSDIEVSKKISNIHSSNSNAFLNTLLRLVIELISSTQSSLPNASNIIQLLNS